MLSVANRTTWENIFNSTDDLYDCNVKIYDKDDNLLLDKVHIASFSIVSRNSFVCDQIPTDECQVKLVDYANIGSSIKTYLTTHQNDRTYYLKLKYVVNGIETTGFKYLVVKSFKIQRLQKEAIFNLASPLSCLSERAVNFLFGYFTTGKSSAWGSRGAKYGITRAELFPVRSLQERKGIKYVFGENTQDTEYTMKDFIVSGVLANLDGNFSGINIYDDYEIDSDNPDKSAINIYGASSGGDTADIVVNFTAASGSAGLPDPIPLTDDMYVRGYTVQTTGGGSWYSHYRVRIENDRIRLVYYPNETRPSDGTNMVWTLRTGSYSLRNPTDNSAAYIQNDGVPTLGSSDDLCLNYVRTYYGNTNIISFECRIDPTLEPLDLIALLTDTKTYKLALEEITINFNGGFNGTIKGRIIDGFVGIALGEQPQTSFLIGDSWTFGGTVIASYLDGSTKDITNQVRFSGGNYVPSSGNYDFATVYIRYTEKGLEKELSYHRVCYKQFTAPTVVIDSISRNELILSITRYEYNSGGYTPNKANVYLTTSEGDILLGEINGYNNITKQFVINETNYPDDWDRISASISAYISADLYDEVLCYFENGKLETSKVVVLDANFGGVADPVVSNLVLPPPSSDQSSPYSWSFTITNNNNETVRLIITDSGNTVSMNLAAGASKTFTNNEYYEFNASMNAKADGELDTDLYCWFQGATEDSRTVIILEAD